MARPEPITSRPLAKPVLAPWVATSNRPVRAAEFGTLPAQIDIETLEIGPGRRGVFAGQAAWPLTLANDLAPGSVD